MKKLLFVAALLMAACSQQPASENEKMVDVTFDVSGDFSLTTTPIATRALDADGKSMTDVWVLDYVGGELKQQVHQAATDADFGSPTLRMSVGAHTLYFVASRGTDAVLDTDARTLSFAKVNDTFWAAKALNVSATTTGTQAVALDRIATKLRITFSDAIPTGAATFNITPAQWHYGFNYTTGEPTTATAQQPITVNIPSSYIGLMGQSVSLFGFSGSDDFTTDVAIDCQDADSHVLGAATVPSVQIKRNRISALTGSLFSKTATIGFSLNTAWLDDYEMTF